MHTLIKKAGMYMKQENNINKKRELHPLHMCAVLFLCVLGVAVIFVDWTKKPDPTRHVESDEGIVEHNNEAIGESLVVVIDAGHGGNDPGKVSKDGILEKDVNLQIAFCLKQELENRGIKTVMLRSTDDNLATEGATNKKNSDMKNRVALINDSNPDYLISIHQNSFTDPKVRGSQVFYHGDSKESEEFALRLQEKLNAIEPKYSREAKEGNDYYLLNKSICPGVILECGFLSCPEETALLTSEHYQQKIASAIADAIIEVH